MGLTNALFTAQRSRIEHIDERTFKYHIDFDRLQIAEDIGATCLARPTNPTGNVLTNAKLERLSGLALSRGIPLIVDNAYGTPFPNIVFADAEPLWNENTIICMSLSKLGLPGARTGIVIARQEIIDLGREVIRPFYQRKMQKVLRHIHECFKGVDYRVHKPEGAFFVWLWFPSLPITSQQLYDRLKQQHVFVVPGHYFFPGLTEPWSHTNECIRVNYAQDHKIVSAGIKAIAEEVRCAYAAC